MDFLEAETRVIRVALEAVRKLRERGGEHAQEAGRMLRGTGGSSWRSKRIGIEGLTPARPLLSNRLIRQALKR
jgi:hypothetical protein